MFGLFVYLYLYNFCKQLFTIIEKIELVTIELTS